MKTLLVVLALVGGTAHAEWSDDTPPSHRCYTDAECEAICLTDEECAELNNAWLRERAEQDTQRLTDWVVEQIEE